MYDQQPSPCFRCKIPHPNLSCPSNAAAAADAGTATLVPGMLTADSASPPTSPFECIAAHPDATRSPSRYRQYHHRGTAVCTAVHRSIGVAPSPACMHASTYLPPLVSPPQYIQPTAPSLPRNRNTPNLTHSWCWTKYETRNAVVGQSHPSSLSSPPSQGIQRMHARVSSSQARVCVIGAQGKGRCRPERIFLVGGGVDGGASAEGGWWGDGGGKRTEDSADRRWVGFWNLGLCYAVMGWDGDTTVRWRRAVK